MKIIIPRPLEGIEANLSLYTMNTFNGGDYSIKGYLFRVTRMLDRESAQRGWLGRYHAFEGLNMVIREI